MALDAIGRRFVPVVLLSAITLSACSSSLKRQPVMQARPVPFKKEICVKVVTPQERRLDRDNDGQLNAAEAKELLNGSYTLIKLNGYCKVTSGVEKVYDLNSDGLIDAVEGDKIKKLLSD